MPTEYDERRRAYIRECLENEPVKPSGMCGHMYYSSVKGKEFNKILRQKMTKEEFDAYTAEPASQANPSSFAEFWKKTQ